MSNPTTGVWQLFEDLNGQTPSGPVSLVGVAPIRYDNGLWLEQAGVNYVRDPLFHSEMAVVFWASNGKDAGITATLARNAGPPAFARWSVESVSSIAGGGHMYLGGTTANGTFAEGDPVTVSAKVKASGINGSHRMMVRGCNAAGGLLGSPVVGDLVTIDGDEHVISATIPSLPATTSKIVVYVVTLLSDTTPVNATSDCLWCNVEKSLYPSSFVPDTVGTTETLEAGYAFTGTPHASSSTRAASSAAISPSGILGPEKGSLAFRFRRKIDTGGVEPIIECGTDGDDWFKAYIDADKLVAWWSSGGALPQYVTSVESIAVDTEYFIYIEWEGNTQALSINNGAKVVGSRDSVTGSWGAGDLVLKAE